MGSRTRGCDLGRGAALGAFGGLGLAVVACSLLVDRDSAQCTIDPDCARFPGTICQNGGCVTAPPPPEGGTLDLDASVPTSCTTTQDCTTSGQEAICRKTDGTCVPLTSTDCQQVAGSYTSDQVLLLGAILPILGPHASTGAALVNAIELGVNEFDFGPTGGLPSGDGGLPRPIAVVFCDESADAVRAATHLVDDLDIPIILGTSDSATTLAVAQAIPRQEFLISPRATADLSDYTATGLLWRTCPSYVYEADAIASLLTQTIEPTFAAQGGAHIAIVHATDVTSTDIDARIVAALSADDAGTTADAGPLLDVSYGDPDTMAMPDYSDAIAAVTDAAALPNVIVVLGSTQAVSNVIGGIEGAWPTMTGPRPKYVLSSGLQVPELLTYVATNNQTSLASRILGTAPGSYPPDYQNLVSFVSRYGMTFDAGTLPGMFGVAQAYDAFYTVVYAAAVARNTDLVGTDVTTALGVMLDGASPAPIDYGPSEIQTTLSALARGSAISIRGASAPLPFDSTTGDVVTNVQVWCIVQAAGTSSYVFESSGLYYVPPSPQAADAGGTTKLAGLLGNGCSL